MFPKRASVSTKTRYSRSDLADKFKLSVAIALSRAGKHSLDQLFALRACNRHNKRKSQRRNACHTCLYRVGFGDAIVTTQGRYAYASRRNGMRFIRVSQEFWRGGTLNVESLAGTRSSVSDNIGYTREYTSHTFVNCTIGWTLDER